MSTLDTRVRDALDQAIIERADALARQMAPSVAQHDRDGRFAHDHFALLRADGASYVDFDDLVLEYGRATAAVILGGTLSLSDTAVPSVGLATGTKFTLLSYTAGLSGTFDGLPEGSSIVLGANTFKLRYNDSSKVTLEVTSSPGGYSAWATASSSPGVGSQS